MTVERNNAPAHLAAREAERLERPGSVDFLDSNFVHWQVIERDASADPGSHSRWCLVFSCADAARRVWEYPSTWRTLSGTELTALSWGH